MTGIASNEALSRINQNERPKFVEKQDGDMSHVTNNGSNKENMKNDDDNYKQYKKTPTKTPIDMEITDFFSEQIHHPEWLQILIRKCWSTDAMQRPSLQWVEDFIRDNVVDK